MAGPDHERLVGEIEAFLNGGPAPRVHPAARMADAPPPPPQKRRRRPRRRLTMPKQPWAKGAVVMVALAAAITYFHPVGASASDHASALPAGPGYEFLRVNPGGRPTRWNPCKPIHYRTNLAAAPPTAADDLAMAISRVAEATGLRFVNDGSTTVIPKVSYGSDLRRGTKPVVIAWARAGQTDKLGMTTPIPGTAAVLTELGRGGPAVAIQPQTGRGVAVSGAVVIDADTSKVMHPGFGPGGLGVVLMHELGHLVGLAHANDSSEIMYPTVVPTKAGVWGSGDLAGLARLGRQSGCLSTPHGGSVIL